MVCYCLEFVYGMRLVILLVYMISSEWGIRDKWGRRIGKDGSVCIICEWGYIVIGILGIWWSLGGGCGVWWLYRIS